MKYMVMESHRSYAVVLSEDGSFSKVANLQYEVGQIVDEIYEIRDSEDMETDLPETTGRAKAEKKKAPFWIYSLSGLAAALVLVLTAVFQLQNGVYGSVYMQINPSVQIDVDRKDRVVDLKGTNEDGKKLISSYSYKGKELDTVMDEMIDLAVARGFLEAGRKVTLTFDAKDDNWVVHRGDQVTQQMEEHIRHLFPDAVSEASEDPSVHIITIPIPSQEEKNSDDENPLQKAPSPVNNKPKEPGGSLGKPQESPQAPSPSVPLPQNPSQPPPPAKDDRDRDEDDEDDENNEDDNDTSAPVKDRGPNIYDRNNDDDDDKNDEDDSQGRDED